MPTIIEIPHTLVDIYQSGALLLVRVESPIAPHSSSTRWRGVALPGTVFVDGGVIPRIISMFPRSEILIERESKAEFVLGRVESPGFQHTAVMLGCVEPSGAAPVANNYRNTAHTRRHIPIGGSVAGEGGVAHRSTQQFYWVAWSRAARDGFCGRGCDVLVSYRCSRDRKYLSRENQRLNLCLGGWSRLDSSTQRLCWVAWSPRGLHLLPTIIEIPHTLVDIYQSGALLLVRVESPIAAHSSSTEWRGVALPGTVFVDGGVMSSYHIDVPEIGNTYRERIEG